MQSVTFDAATANPALTKQENVTYQWEPVPGLSNLNTATPVFTPTAPGDYTFRVTARTGPNCAFSGYVYLLRVVDVRCGNKNDKVSICHKGKEQCISHNAEPAHLAHGDQ
jgi:hypothetical protein